MSRWMTVAAAAPLALVTIAATASSPPGSSGPPGSVAAEPGPIGTPIRLEVDGALDSISPDGRWIAGVGRDRVPCIWDIDTLDATCADVPVGNATHPTRPSMFWSPGSDRVAFTPDVFVQGRDGDVYVMDLDGTLVNLTDDGYEGGLIGSDAPDDLSVDTLPTWSPDGTRLAFVRTVTSRGMDSVMVVDADGGEPSEVAVAPVPGSFVVWPNLRWVADDSILLTTNPTNQDDPGRGVWTLDPGSGDVTEIVSESGRTFELTDVSPDGSRALVIDPFEIDTYASNPADPEWATVVTEIDLATGESTPRPWLSADAAELVPAGIDVGEAIDAGLTAATGPQVYSPDGTMWFGRYDQPRADAEYVVIADVASGELVGAVNLAALDLRVGPSAVQWVDGGVLAKSAGGTAVWIPVVTG